jgi:hypothetical protein
MHRLDDSLSESLKDIMLANDYLSEDVIGANFIDDTLLSSQPLYGTLVLHQFQKHGRKLSDVVNDAINTGKLRTEVGLDWIEQSNSGIMFSMEYFIYKDTLRMFYSDRELIREDRLIKLLRDDYNTEKTRQLRDYYYISDVPLMREKIKWATEQYFEQELTADFLVLPQPRITASVQEGSEHMMTENTKVVTYKD